MSLDSFEFHYWAWRTERPPASVLEAERSAKEEMVALTFTPVVLVVDDDDGVVDDADRAFDDSDTDEDEDYRCNGQGNIKRAKYQQPEQPRTVDIATNSYVLCAHSPVFRAMLHGDGQFKEAITARIELPGKNSSLMRFVLDFLSSFSFEFSSPMFTCGNLLPAIVFFREYQMASPLAKAVQFLKSVCKAFARNPFAIKPVLYHLKKAVDLHVEEAELLILCEIRAACFARDSLDDMMSLDQLKLQKSFKLLGPITQARLCALWQQ